MNRRMENENRRTAQVQSEYKAAVRKNTIEVETSSKDGNSKAVNIIIIFLSATVIILLAFLIQNLFKYSANKKEIEKTEKNEIASNLDLSVDGEFVQDLYHKIPMLQMGGQIYNATTTKYEDMSENDRLAYVFSVLEKNSTDEEFEYSKVNEEYKKIFGTDKVAPKINVKYNDLDLYEYIADGDLYQARIYNNGFMEKSLYSYKTNIEKVEKNDKGSQVYIYDKFVCFDSTGDVNSFGVYKTADKSVYIETGLTRGHDSGINKDIFGGKTVEQLLEDNIDKGGMFKHTFIVDDTGKFSWYSSEYIN